MLKTYIRDRLKEKEILLMTHIVLGYPSFEDSFRIVEKMVNAGVDLMELQIPFSEPIADGPVILSANQKALAAGSTVDKCMEVAQKITDAFDIPFLFMTYYNILFAHGVTAFVQKMAEKGIKGAIVPDLPPEEADDYLAAMETNGCAPIFIFSPTTPLERMRTIDAAGKGFIYCVARKGVTGKDTAFSDQLNQYLETCRMATSLPLALGFGVKSKEDVTYLKGKADIAVIGTQTIRLIEKEGIGAVESFIGSLLD